MNKFDLPGITYPVSAVSISESVKSFLVVFAVSIAVIVHVHIWLTNAHDGATILK